MQELEIHSNISCMQRLPFNAKFLFQGQGLNVKSSSPPPPPDPFGSEALAICSSFITTSTPSPAQPPPSDERRLAKAPHPTHILKCPRCASLDTKFCYYNNYSLSQPRYFCKNCKRYWTAGGTLRNVPVGGGLRKNKRSKLKLAAEAEAAIAACDSAGSTLPVQQQHYEDKCPSPEVPSSGAMGSCITSTSSVVSGIPANFAGVSPPCNFHSSNTSHLIRTSSGSDNCSGSTVEYAGSDNCTGMVAAAFLLDQQQNSNQLQHFFGDVRAQAALPQFYSGYAASIPPSNQQYASNASDQGASYQALCYGNQQSSRSMNFHVGEVGGSNSGHASIYGNGSVPYNAMADIGGCEGGDLSSNERKEVKEDIITSNPTYDWQIISESLFSGAGSEGFMPLPGSSWPDFS